MNCWDGFATAATANVLLQFYMVTFFYPRQKKKNGVFLSCFSFFFPFNAELQSALMQQKSKRCNMQVSRCLLSKMTRLRGRRGRLICMTIKNQIIRSDAFTCTQKCGN